MQQYQERFVFVCTLLLTHDRERYIYTIVGRLVSCPQVEKIDLYADRQATMETWDQAKLEEVVGKKQIKKATETDIVCKHFLDAIETKKYGWFWECPTGLTCHYRHALPPGFVLKDKKNPEDEANKQEETSLEELIDERVRHLDLSKCTRVTPETFAKWKLKNKAKKKKEEAKKATADMKKNKGKRIMSGRGLFEFNPEMFVDDGQCFFLLLFEVVVSFNCFDHVFYRGQTLPPIPPPRLSRKGEAKTQRRRRMWLRKRKSGALLSGWMKTLQMMMTKKRRKIKKYQRKSKQAGRLQRLTKTYFWLM